MTEHQRRIRAQKQKDYLEIIQVFCGEHDCDYEIILPTQIRVYTTVTVDIYPNSNKFFNITTQRWGQFTDIIKFLNDCRNSK